MCFVKKMEMVHSISYADGNWIFRVYFAYRGSFPLYCFSIRMGGNESTFLVAKVQTISSYLKKLQFFFCFIFKIWQTSIKDILAPKCYFWHLLMFLNCWVLVWILICQSVQYLKEKSIANCISCQKKCIVFQKFWVFEPLPFFVLFWFLMLFLSYYRFQ